MHALPEFDLVTDHEAQKVIYLSQSKPSARTEHWVLCLQPYKYKVCYVPSRKNIADALSRFTKTGPGEQSQDDDEYIRATATHAVPRALKIREAGQALTEDLELQIVRKCLVDGKWDSAPKQHLHISNELT